LRGVIAHLVRGRQERDKDDPHGCEQGDHDRVPASGYREAGRYEEKTDGEAEGRKCLEGWQHSEFYDGRANDGTGGAECERDSAAVG
jgi:hypothetical protein